MKKFAYIFALFTILTGTTACSLDKLPVTQQTVGEIATVQDIQGLRLGMYSLGRALFTGQQAFWTDYQSDVYNELTTSGNRGGYFFRWFLQSSDTDVAGMWNNNYATISRANLVMSSVDNIYEAQTAADKALLDRYKGEAYLIRAMVYRNLALRFCVDYEPTTADDEYGVPLQNEYVYNILTFVPNGRGTLEDTYQQILDDIAAAKPLLTAAKSANPVFLNANSVTALEVQVDVDMHNYDDAITAAAGLISQYPLETTQLGLQSMWWKDESTETIFQFGITLLDRAAALRYTDLHGGRGTGYIHNTVFIPGQWVVDLYDPANDFRFDTYISRQAISNGLGGYAFGYIMHKFLGNERLRVAPTNPNWFTMAKVFRIADIILLKAEAEWRLDNTDGLATLNTLRVSRGLDELAGVTGDDLFQEIKNERVRELIGEGGRIPDLKRWGDGFTRIPQTGAGLPIRNIAANTMTVTAGADRFLLPIPMAEFGVNPNIAGQQNPGYNQ